MNLLHPDTATTIFLIVSFFIPLASAALGRAHWPAELIGILTLVISAANGFFSEWGDAGSHFAWQTALSRTVLSFVLAVAGHYGLWKNTATNAKLLAFPAAKPAAPAPAPAVTPPAAPATPTTEGA